MDTKDIRNELEKIIISTNSCNVQLIPAKVLANLKKWNWGGYGWVSPVSIMVTATWKKYFFPELDCCKIWAKDEAGNAIKGGYSLRSDDEKITIPLLAKYDLCHDFCSPNSGMQGSRAIEKMRSLKRLNTNFAASQKTLFDLQLFASILNQINDLNKTQLLEVLKFFIITSKEIKRKREQINSSLREQSKSKLTLLEIIKEIPDPELTKCAVAACFMALFSSEKLKISGIEDAKTAADARSKKPGDLTLENNHGTPIAAIEVKDKTQSIDWNNIEKANRIINAHKTLNAFFFILESRDAATSEIVNEMVKSQQLNSTQSTLISIMSLFALYSLATLKSTNNELVKMTSHLLTRAPMVKPETKSKWLKLLSK